MHRGIIWVYGIWAHTLYESDRGRPRVQYDTLASAYLKKKKNNKRIANGRKKIHYRIVRSIMAACVCVNSNKFSEFFLFRKYTIN